MSTAAITTLVKMMESLSDDRQEQVLDHLREYLADLSDETEWDDQFARTQNGLQAAAQQARKEIYADLAKPLNFDQR